MTKAQDPFKYYRIEARELIDGLNHGVLELERGEAGREPVARMLRLAHTLKGAARVVKQLPSAELAHAIEEALEPFRETQVEVPRQTLNNLLRLMQSLERHLSQVSAAPGADGSAAQGTESPAHVGVVPADGTVPVGGMGDAPLATVRVEVGEMDALLGSVMEAAIQVSTLQSVLASVDECRHLTGILLSQIGAPTAAGAAPAPGGTRARALIEDLQGTMAGLRNDVGRIASRAGAELLQARDTANRLRLLPASALFVPLERAARDAAGSLGKQIEFVTAGADVRLDTHVLNVLRDALLHVVRNAVVHGIESPAARRAAGKPAAGRIRLQVERRGHRAAFMVEDDGAGVNLPAIREALIHRGQLTALESSALSDTVILQRLLHSGVSTSAQVTAIAGRGIGLDVLSSTAVTLKGALDLRTQPGQSTTVEIVVPISLALLAALEVEIGGQTLGIPLEAVRETTRLHPQDLAHTPQGDALPYQGAAIPYLALSRLFPTAATHRDGPTTAVILQANGQLAALGVDRLKGVANVVIKPLPALVATDPIISGASLNPAGDPQPVLDPTRLVQRICQEVGASPHSTATPAPRRPILVVDDSLTTRMLEQSILESAGYAVETATSAEAALALARENQYSLFVVDVEMPGMDGYTFVAQTREDPQLREIPAILVTSRGAPEDRRRGAQVGARAYIVKSEFDQGFLLQAIRGLIG